MHRTASWYLIFLFLGVFSILAIVIIPWIWHRLRGGADRKRAPRSSWGLLTVILGFAVLGFMFLMYFSVRQSRTTGDSYRLVVPDHAEVWKAQSRMIGGRNPNTEPPWVGQARPARMNGRQLTSLGYFDYSLPVPGPAGWLNGFSTRLTDSPEAALDLARDSAAEQLQGLILLNFINRRVDPGISFPEARKQAAHLLTHERIKMVEVNQYVEEADFAGGSKYRSVVLVQADQRTLDEMTRELIDSLRSRDRGVAAAASESETENHVARLAQAFGLVVIAFLIATFFNASRAGRLAWPLRITSFTLLSAIYLALAYFRGWVDFFG